MFFFFFITCLFCRQSSSSDSSSDAEPLINSDMLRPRSFMTFAFRKLSDYEEFHNLTWLCCDLAWNIESKGFWWPFAVFTALIAFDIQVLSAASRIRDGILDTAHYFFQILWFLSNAIWVYGDFYLVAKEAEAETAKNETETEAAPAATPAPAGVNPLFTPTLPTDYRFGAAVVSIIALSFALAFHTYWICATWYRSRALVADSQKKS
jgi:hypothetical protein